jgi:hypothetical protein
MSKCLRVDRKVTELNRNREQSQSVFWVDRKVILRNEVGILSQRHLKDDFEMF